MKKLTKREKMLIYVLACLVIVAGGIYFVALPAYARYASVSSQAAEAEFTQESMTMAIDSMPSTMTAGNEANAKLTTLKAPFSVKLANEGLDVLLTQLCLSYSLTPTMLSIEDNSAQDVPTFVANSSGAAGMVGSGDPSSNSGSSTGASNTTGTSTASGTNTTTGSSNTTGSTSTSGTTATENSNSATSSNTATNDSTQSTAVSSGVSTPTGVVSMELTGTQADFYRLLDAVSARPDMIVSKFEIAPKSAISSTSTSTYSSVATQGLNGGAVTISVTFNVYMMDK
ncbi:hypothetical protein GH808_08365 [Acetobacterium fimetarium]|uniref:Uncharacterized protein n=1 Tax=Acetobacterium fimetarium TaxID=52691 RepID=A0ABR6WUZ5_9FIRM|nr:hypothetical protein [Acetobacterium fimetarium]MBC3804444.1 hypothetical protein [Acetobacterium fimetarium]